MDTDARHIDVDAPIRVKHCHGATPVAAIAHLHADGETHADGLTRPQKVSGEAEMWIAARP